MEDKLTAKDFLAVIGILAIGGIIYEWIRIDNHKKTLMDSAMAQGLQLQQNSDNTAQSCYTGKSNSDVFNPSHYDRSMGAVALGDGMLSYTTVYDTSESNTIGTKNIVIQQPS